MKNKKNIIGIIIAILIVGGMSFFGGMQYQKSLSQNNTGNRNQFVERGVGQLGRSGNTASIRGGFLGGEILSKDEKSITVKLQDGGSKIIFFSEKMRIMKSTEGIKDDLVVGQQITVTGTTNSDGSVIAESIQLRNGTSSIPLR